MDAQGQTIEEIGILMGHKKSAIKKKHRRMMQARETNAEHIEVMKREAEIEADRERHGGKITIDELVYKTLHPYE